CLRRGDQGDIHAPYLLHLVVIDLGEDELLAHADVQIAAPIELPLGDAFEVFDARQGDVEQFVHKLIHPVAAQRHLRRDREPPALSARDPAPSVQDPAPSAPGPQPSQEPPSCLRQPSWPLGLASWSPELPSSPQALSALFPRASSRPSFLDLLPAPLADPHLRAISQVAVADSSGAAALRADHHHPAAIDRCLFLYDTALGHLLRRFGVPFDHVHALNDDLTVLGQDLEDLAALASLP